MSKLLLAVYFVVLVLAFMATNFVWTREMPATNCSHTSSLSDGNLTGTKYKTKLQGFPFVYSSELSATAFGSESCLADSDPLITYQRTNVGAMVANVLAWVAAGLAGGVLIRKAVKSHKS